MDIITCGTCHAQYPLDEITFFIQHRAYECRPAANGVHESTYCDKGLTCSACGCHFRSAWALLQHVQEDHNLHLFIDRSCHEGPPRQLRPTAGPQRSAPAPVHSPQSPYAADDNRFCPQVLDYVGEPRSAVGEWIESCNTSPLTSSPPCFCRGARSGQTEAPNPDIVSENNDDEENVPLDLHVDFASSNGSRSVSEGQWDSENSSPSVGEYTQQLHSDTLSSPSSAIIPKKRKWSSNEPTPSNEQIPNVDQNTDINVVPRWKYSAHLTELVPKLIEPADKQFAKQRNGTCGYSFSGSCGVQRSDPKNPRVPLNAEDKSNICRLGSDEESVVKGIPQLPALIEGHLDSNGDNHWHPPHQSSDNTVTHDHTESSVEGSGQSFHGKKRRYPTTKPFKCELCDYSFNQRIHLKKHLSKHTGFKPFKCNVCDYSTVERSHLKVHIRIHTGEKPYRCTFCDYATAQNSTLKIHLKRHHGGKMFRCKTCSKTFTEATALHQHETVHPERDAAYPEPAPHERDEAS